MIIAGSFFELFLYVVGAIMTTAYFSLYWETYGRATYQSCTKIQRGLATLIVLVFWPVCGTYVLVYMAIEKAKGK